MGREGLVGRIHIARRMHTLGWEPEAAAGTEDGAAPHGMHIHAGPDPPTHLLLDATGWWSTEAFHWGVKKRHSGRGPENIRILPAGRGESCPEQDHSIPGCWKAPRNRDPPQVSDKCSCAEPMLSRVRTLPNSRSTGCFWAGLRFLSGERPIRCFDFGSFRSRARCPGCDPNQESALGLAIFSSWAEAVH